MSGRFALVIGNTEYCDPGLAALAAPGKDAADFARILQERDLCAFDDVKVLVNQLSSSVVEAIDVFFDERKPDDLLVLYFSGHGVRDEFGSLYLAFRNTFRSRLRSTAVKAEYIREAMDQSRSKRQVLILDCCNSGAFPQGTKTEVGGGMGLVTAFQGYGRYVLTASDATQFAWEGDKVIGQTENSLFTHFLIQGLKGEADTDADGTITVDELYDYAFDEISRVTPKQTPTKSASKQEGEIVLRHIERLEDIRAVALPDDLSAATEDSRTFVREGSVQQLAKLLGGKNLGLARSARAMLERMANEDDSIRVRQAASQVLAPIHELEKEAEEERRAKEEAECQEIQRMEQERLERERAEQDRIALEKAEAERKAEEERRAKEEAQRLAVLKIQQEHLDRERAEGEAVAARQKAEAGRIAKARLEAERIAESNRLAAEKADVSIPVQATSRRAGPVPRWLWIGGAGLFVAIIGIYALLNTSAVMTPLFGPPPMTTATHGPAPTAAGPTALPTVKPASSISAQETPQASAPVPPLALAGTPIPFEPAVITAQNAPQAMELARWGKGAVSAVAYSPRGDLFAVATSLGVYIYNADTLQEVSLLNPDRSVKRLAFSPDGKMVVTDSADMTVRLWDVQAGSLLQTLQGHTDQVTSVAFSPDGQTVASGSYDRSIRLWRVSDGVPLGTLSGHADAVLSVAFSPDGKSLASGSSDHTVGIWRVSDGVLIQALQGHAAKVYSVAFAPDGKTLASGSDDNTLRLWRTIDGTPLQIIRGVGGSVLGVAFSPDGKELASGSWDGAVRVWFLGENSRPQILQSKIGPISSVVFSPDGKRLASSAFYGGSVQFWHTSDGTLAAALDDFMSTINSIAFSPDGQTLASGSSDYAVRLWNVSDGTLLKTLQGHTSSVADVAFSPDGRLLASAGYADDNTVRLWRVSDGTLLHTLRGHASGVEGIAFAPDGATLASGSTDGTVRLWRVSDGTLLRTDQTGDTYSVAFSPDGQLLAAGSGDRVLILHANDGARLRTLKGHTDVVDSVAFSPDGQALASGSVDSTARLWRVSDGSQLQKLKGSADPVRSVAFSSDGQVLASASDGAAVRLWQVSNGSLLQTLEGHTRDAWSASFSPDGSLLASAGYDGTIRLWGVGE